MDIPIFPGDIDIATLGAKLNIHQIVSIPAISHHTKLEYIGIYKLHPGLPVFTANFHKTIK
jgi:hypothetical protein